MVTSSKSKTILPTCGLDESILNAETLPDMTDIGLSFFASLCGRNRGAFVMHPSDGNTWGCTSFPPNFAQLAGLGRDVPLKDANALKEAYQQGNTTAAETVQLLDYFVKSVYKSSANVDKDPYACNVDGLAKLQCKPVTTNIKTIRSVTLAGVFTPALWATGGRELSVEESDSFYVAQDFTDMKNLGLNTVQIPVPLEAFNTDLTDEKNVKERLSKILGMAADNGLQAILALVGADNDNAVTAAAHYAAANQAVFAVIVPSMQSVGPARAAEQELTIMVPIDQGQLPYLQLPDKNVFPALDMSHSATVADVASSTSTDDRMKLFYHEGMSCIARSPLEYSACFHDAPIYVNVGFDLSIDDCIHRNIDDGVSFIDYGQCDRFEETINSKWWARHRSSFAARQLFSYEHGLGWTFSAWKLYGDSDVGAITTFEKLLSLRDVAAAGLFPELKEGIPSPLACLNPAESDFMMGDATLAPTMAPPPDCGYGWWNATINDCSYWIPPPPTEAPTSHPTAAPFACPEVPPPVPCPEATTSKTALGLSATGGAVVAFVLGAILARVMGRRPGYAEVPNVIV